ncbi:hypothetical protein EV384_0326 [Micromonospora kangleipakensis]|uniref:Uncharacterized protein n=1 Tax=Micromonospora kangleipakensis TaxID=1077942 RepID=A0A4Q8B3A9_9ACTN|nr:hypothetical protein [Micromonospora kangleipakensis]RZU71990.1 hypothetical protein EV384_0326 [Micromonospora kangleipakensis]
MHGSSVVVVDGRTRIAISFTVTNRAIGIEVVASPDQLRALDVVVG